MVDKQWQLTPGFNPVSCVWGEEAVVYDKFSGDTHLLDTLSLLLLEHLAHNSSSESGLIAVVATDLELEHDAELLKFVRARLDALVRLGIVQGAES